MKVEAVYHRPRNEFAYYDTNGTATILLRVGSNDILRARLFWFDKYCIDESIAAVEMESILSDSLFSYFRISITPKYRRLQYYFELMDRSGAVWYLDEIGCHQTADGCTESCFQMPYLNRTDAITVPGWAKEAVFYQIFPDSFARKEPTPTGEDFPSWGSEPDVVAHLGGNLGGLRDRLDYLSGLGINALYLCPIFQSNSCHRYNTYDYFKVDSRLGTLEDFKSLLMDCHRRGIRVVLDAVFNHTCDTFPRFQDVLENGSESPYVNWYFIKEYPLAVDEVYRYERFSFERHMPKLNTENREVRRYLLEVARYWTQLGIDGWRLDVANEIDLSFWRNFRREVKAINPEALIIGEVWGDSQPYLAGDMFDSVMNYPFTTICRSHFLDGTLGATAFRQEINRLLTHYPEPMTQCMYNLLGSHDTARWLTLAKGREEAVACSVVFQFLFVGMPAIYYGDETGMVGEDFIKARRCMCFTPANMAGQTLLKLYRNLVAFRKAHPALSEGVFRWLDPQPIQGSAPLAFLRRTDGDTVVMIWNPGDEPVQCKLPWDGQAGQILSLAPMGYKIFANGQEVML